MHVIKLSDDKKIAVEGKCIKDIILATLIKCAYIIWGRKKDICYSIFYTFLTFFENIKLLVLSVLLTYKNSINFCNNIFKYEGQ